MWNINGRRRDKHFVNLNAALFRLRFSLIPSSLHHEANSFWTRQQMQVVTMLGAQHVHKSKHVFARESRGLVQWRGKLVQLRGAENKILAQGGCF